MTRRKTKKKRKQEQKVNRFRQERDDVLIGAISSPKIVMKGAINR